MTEIAEGAIVVVPLFVGFATHGFCIRANVLGWATRPISVSLFGANKTYRGPVCVAFGTALGFVLIRPPVLSHNRGLVRMVLIGLLVGAVAMAAELPNSFIKRRFGIAPGTQTGGLQGLAFHVVDQLDVVFGAWVVLAWVTTPTWARIGGSLAMMYVGHQMVSMIGYWLGMRTTPR